MLPFWSIFGTQKNEYMVHGFTCMQEKYKTSMETHTKCREALIPSGAGEVEEGRKKRKEGKKDSHILS